MSKYEAIFLKPNQQLILFDGVCNMCNSTVQFIMKYDTKKRFVFASLQGETAKKLSKHFNFVNTDLNSILLYDGNNIYDKSTAVLKITSQLKFPISLLAVFFIVPSFIRNWVYNYIKNNRYKWFGKKEQCYLPTTEEKKRFYP